MQLIEHIELGSAAASITFSDIPQTFTDLYLVYSTRNTTDINSMNFLINGSTSNQTARRLQGNGSAASSSTYTEIQSNPSGATANTFANAAIYIPNYTSSVAKSISMDNTMENNGTTSFMNIEAWLWNSTSAITSLALEGRAGASLAQYSRASLYGILAGSDGTTTVS
jgi:hypothetical protein